MKLQRYMNKEATKKKDKGIKFQKLTKYQNIIDHPEDEPTNEKRERITNTRKQMKHRETML